MDPALDPPPLPAQPTVVVPATAAAAAAAANPTPTTQPPAHSHPPYAEMITEAIAALKERNGSSKRAIAKFIETNYPNLPPTHSALLTHHLKRLKTNGQVVMVKHSYKLPRSAPVAVNGSVNAVSSDPSSAGPKRRPGRPPKPKSDAVQAAVPVFPPSMDMNAAPGVVPVAQPPQNVAVGPGNGTAAGGTPRGRGRPPKRGGLKRGPGRPPKAGGPAGGVGVGRGRGRPQIAVPAAQAARGKGPGRPRGRPPKPINVVEGLAPGAPVAAAPVAAPPAFAGAANAGPVPVVGGAAAPVAGKRRGRPPKAAGEANKPAKLTTVQPKKPRKLSGKPLGRPKKDASATGTRPDSQLLVAYLDLKAKLENLQSRVHQTAALIKPSLNNEAAINALQELEMAAVNVNGPSNVQNQQPLPEQPQPGQIQPQS